MLFQYSYAFKKKHLFFATISMLSCKYNRKVKYTEEYKFILSCEDLKLLKDFIHIHIYIIFNIYNK